MSEAFLVGVSVNDGQTRVTVNGKEYVEAPSVPRADARDAALATARDEAWHVESYIGNRALDRNIARAIKSLADAIEAGPPVQPSSKSEDAIRTEERRALAARLRTRAEFIATNPFSLSPHAMAVAASEYRTLADELDSVKSASPTQASAILEADREALREEGAKRERNVVIGYLNKEVDLTAAESAKGLLRTLASLVKDGSHQRWARDNGAGR
jgi:hypothetical protein